MNVLNQVTTVRGYAEYLGLDPTDRSVLRKIQRQCERGDLPAKLDQGAWLIKLPHTASKGELIMKDWKSLKDINHDGMLLSHAGYGNDENRGLNNNKISLFYVNLVSIEKTPNHFSVTWDFNEFLSTEASGAFEWPSPHASLGIENERKQQLIDYFSGPSFTAYRKKVMFNGKNLTIINRPVEFSNVAGTFNYYAGAIDPDGEVYQVFWNLFNIFDPIEIEMTVDNSRYCKHCLQRWMPNADNIKCNHEWVKDSE